MMQRESWISPDKKFYGKTCLRQGLGEHLMLAHGLMGSIAIDDAVAMPAWEELIAHPAIRAFTRYDLRGHGRSFADHAEESYLWPALAQDLQQLWQERAADAKFLAGISMSASALLYLASAADHGPSPHALILITPTTSGPARDRLRPVYRNWAELAETQGMDGLLAHMTALPMSPLFARDYPDIRMVAYAGLRTADPLALAACLRAAAESDWPNAELLKTIHQPCLILCREGDPAHPVAMGRQLAELLPNAQLVISETRAAINLWPNLIGDFIAANPCES
jgi:3-oxoadipate enol-lactonase